MRISFWFCSRSSRAEVTEDPGLEKAISLTFVSNTAYSSSEICPGVTIDICVRPRTNGFSALVSSKIKTVGRFV